MQATDINQCQQVGQANVSVNLVDNTAKTATLTLQGGTNSNFSFVVKTDMADTQSGLLTYTVTLDVSDANVTVFRVPGDS